MTAESPVMSGNRIAHDELRTASVTAIGRLDAAAQGLDKALGDGEAEPGAGAAAIAIVGPVELLEQLVKRLRRDARPFIPHDDLDAITGGPHLDLDAAAGRRILGGIVQEVEQRLLRQ